MLGYVYKEKFIKPAANAEGSSWGRDRALKREGKWKEKQSWLAGVIRAVRLIEQ